MTVELGLRYLRPINEQVFVNGYAFGKCSRSLESFEQTTQTSGYLAKVLCRNLAGD